VWVAHLRGRLCVQGFHIEKQLYERSELEGLSALLDADLKKAAGANYDMGGCGSRHLG